MRHYYTVDGYDKIDQTHFLLGEDGLHFVILDQLELKNPESLIGKRISVSYLKPYIEIGINPKIEE